MTTSTPPTSPPVDPGYVPSPADLAEIDEWFTRYDALAQAGDVAGTADLAHFPLNVVTDDSAGNASAQQLDRAAYLKLMGGVLGGAEELRMESRRTPHFLTGSLVVVFTEAEFTIGDRRQRVRYADLLVKVDGGWRFQTMVQGGWG